MRSKGRQSKFSLAILFVGIFAFWWGIAVLTQNGAITHPTDTSSATPSGYTPQSISDPVAVSVSVSNNTYTYSGSLPLSSSCESVGTGLAVRGSNPAHVTVLVTLMSPLTACAQASTGANEQPFSVSLSVKSGAKAVFDGLTVNGVIVPTKLQEPPSK